MREQSGREQPERVDLLIVGAGPCGLAAAIAAGRAGLRAVVLDRGCLVSGVAAYPPYMTFFSTAERIAIGGVPFAVAAEKPSRRDALAYYRAVAAHFGLDVRQYEEVVGVEPRGGGAGGARFAVRSRPRGGAEREWLAGAVVVATGYFGTPSRLGVPGEELPHVSHYFDEGHYSFQQEVVVVGGGNSAVDAALELYRAGGRVTMVHFGPGLDPNVKPWVLPDVAARLREGAIRGVWHARVTAIEPDAVRVAVGRGEDAAEARAAGRPTDERVLPARLVYLTTGFLPNTRVLEALGVAMDPVDGIPAHDPATMETSVPGVYIAGVIASGFHANRIFIENGRDHGALIVRHLTGVETPTYAPMPPLPVGAGSAAG
jgi:thioredoxin reductase (NADPH)